MFYLKMITFTLLISEISYSKSACTGSIMDKVGCLPQKGQFVLSFKHPHEASSYTQGLVWHKSSLYESSGKVGQCKIFKANTFKTKKHKPFEKQWEFIDKSQKDVFCEGLTYHPPTDLWYQLTWKAQTAYVLKLEKNSFKIVQTFNYSGEGWGIESCAGALFMTNGTNELYRIDPKTFKTLEKLSVTYAGKALNNLNEMACYNGGLLTNIYYANEIVRIETSSGIVSESYSVDIAKLLSTDARKKLKPDEVLNGLAWDRNANLLYITGKNWPLLFSGKLELNKR